MTWYDAILELCFLVGYDETIDDILDTAIEENMLSRGQAGQIARTIDRNWLVDAEGCYVPVSERR